MKFYHFIDFFRLVLHPKKLFGLSLGTQFLFGRFLDDLSDESL